MDPRVPALGSDGQVRLVSHLVDVERDGLPTTVEVAIVPHDGSHGCFLVSSGDRVVRPSRAQRKIAVHLADQLLASTHSPSSVVAAQDRTAKEFSQSRDSGSTTRHRIEAKGGPPRHLAQPRPLADPGVEKRPADTRLGAKAPQNPAPYS